MTESKGVAGDSVLQTEILESLVSVVNYNDWLTSLAAPYLGEDPVELGSGLGGYAQRWLDSGVPQMTVTDLDESRLAALRCTFADDPRVHVKRMDLLQPEDQNHSCLVAFNVLEHIDDHVGALRGTHTALRPGGYVVMYVPAFEFAMSSFDRAVGHVRRYTIASLRAAYEDAGLTVDEIKYVNMPGLISWVLGARLLRMTPADGGLVVRTWDRLITPAARKWEAKHSPPFGQSVFCVGRVPG